MSLKNPVTPPRIDPNRPTSSAAPYPLRHPRPHMWTVRVEIYLNNIIKYSLTQRFIKYIRNLQLSVTYFGFFEPMKARKS